MSVEVPTVSHNHVCVMKTLTNNPYVAVIVSANLRITFTASTRPAYICAGMYHSTIILFLKLVQMLILRTAHPCEEKCELDGICNIETQPSKIVEEFQGRHETFSYTKASNLLDSIWAVIDDKPTIVVHAGGS